MQSGRQTDSAFKKPDTTMIMNKSKMLEFVHPSDKCTVGNFVVGIVVGCANNYFVALCTQNYNVNLQHCAAQAAEVQPMQETNILALQLLNRKFALLKQVERVRRNWLVDSPEKMEPNSIGTLARSRISMAKPEQYNNNYVISLSLTEAFASLLQSKCTLNIGLYFVIMQDTCVCNNNSCVLMI